MGLDHADPGAVHRVIVLELPLQTRMFRAMKAIQYRAAVLTMGAAGLLAAAPGCGPGARNCSDPVALANDRSNCGACGVECNSDQGCMAGACYDLPCEPGKVSKCYTGTADTANVGSCSDGKKTCAADKTWGLCEGEVLPGAEVCGNNIDDNCSGQVDEDTDLDGDGFTTCAGDCCDSVQCGKPALVNPGSFEIAGNMVDDDCDGMVDNSAVTCDSTLQSNSNLALDYARAMDLCQVATANDKKWGIISAQFTRTDGTGLPANVQRSIRAKFGNAVLPKAGAQLALFSTGNAAGKNDINPPYVEFDGASSVGTSAPFPADFLAANGGKLPNAPGCPEPFGARANDPIMLTLTVRVPSNARSFSLASNFFSSEFPEFTCTAFNDFFVVLLDSMFNGMPANPTDKNLAFYQDAGGGKYPVGVNLAYSANGTGTGLFNQCVNGETGCSGSDVSMITTCQSTNELIGTGFDTPRSGSCDNNSLMGGGTGWLVTRGNVVGGEVIKLRIAIWDTSDASLDSLVVLDNFQWSVEGSDPGTVVE